MHYLNFDLKIHPASGGVYPVTAHFGTESTRGTMRFPYDAPALENALLRVQNALLRSAVLHRQVLTPEAQAVQDFGERLFTALFGGDVMPFYDASGAQASQHHQGLRVRLQVLAPELASLPWELLYDPRQGEYLCFLPDRPIVRYLDTPQPVQPLAIELPLRVLAMVASPTDQAQLNGARERQRLQDALTPLEQRGLLKLRWVQGQTWHDVQDALRQRDWHIFHFIGHGAFAPDLQEGVLALADEQGKTHLISATDLGRLLVLRTSLRLVVLNACQGATGSATDRFSSIAATLVRKGVPAVLAMQYEITDQAAIELTRGFYGGLAASFPVDESLTQARTAISLGQARTLEWVTPVLYLHARDGVLFDLPPMSTIIPPNISQPPPPAPPPMLVAEALVRPGTPPGEQADQTGASIFSATTHIPPRLPSAGQGSQAGLSLSPAETPLIPGQGGASSVAPTEPGAPLVTGEAADGGGGSAPRRNESLLAEAPGSPVPRQPPSRQGISRRQVVVAGGAGLVLLGSGAAALLLAQKTGSPVSIPPGTRPTPTATATVPTPQPGATLFTYQGHTAAVNSLAWSPDGTRIASASDDLTVQVWDAPTGAHPLLYRAHGNKVNTVAWSPNGAYLASAGLDTTVRVWEAATGKTVAVYTGHQSTVWSVAWSPDSRRLASASSDGTVHVWEALSQQGVFTYRRHTNHVWSVAWSPEGRYVASASKDETVRIWDPTTSADLYVYTRHTFGVGKVAWSPGGDRIASGSYDGTVQVWDPSTGGNRLVHQQAGVPLGWSTSGQRIASADQDKLVQVWSASSGTTLLTYRQHTAPVADIAWSPGGTRIASASADHTVQVWAVAADAS
jgi:hypothetical protein